MSGDEHLVVEFLVLELVEFVQFLDIVFQQLHVQLVHLEHVELDQLQHELVDQFHQLQHVLDLLQHVVDLLQHSTSSSTSSTSSSTSTTTSTPSSSTTVDTTPPGTPGSTIPGEPLGALGDYVWFDNDGDGTQGELEKGIGGVTVVLRDGDGGYLAQTATDPSGFYLFDRLGQGEYIVQFVLPDLEGLVEEAWTVRDVGPDDMDSDPGPDGWTVVISLGLGEIDLTWDAGIVASGILGGEGPEEGTLPFTGDEASQAALLSLGILASGAILVIGHSGPDGLTGRRQRAVTWEHEGLTRYRRSRR